MSLEFSQELDSPIISPTFAPQDAGEIGLRPKLLNDYTGQEKAKGNLSVYIEAARRRGEPLDHTLLYGPPAHNSAIVIKAVTAILPTDFIYSARSLYIMPPLLYNLSQSVF